MVKNLTKLFFVFIYFIAFFLLVVVSIPAGAEIDGWVKSVTKGVNGGVAIDSYNNIYVTGTTSYPIGDQIPVRFDDIFLVKYDGYGTMRWARLLGTALFDRGKGVAVDSKNNIYITGSTDGDLGGQTNPSAIEGIPIIFLAKYDTNGNILWVKLLGTEKAEGGSGVAVDSNNNIYVTGSTNGDLGGETNASGVGSNPDPAVVGSADIFLAKYDELGNRQWVKLLGTETTDVGTDVAVDSNNNIYITGYTDGDLGGETNAGVEDTFLAKYDGSGTMQWVKLLGTNSFSRSFGVATSSDGNIYITGSTRNNLGGETNAGVEDIFLTKYDTNGNILWVRLLGTAVNDYGSGVATDKSGNIYITGYTDGDLGGETNAGVEDTFLAKYDGSGTMQWVKLLGTEWFEEGESVATEPSGNIYITGYTDSNLGSQSRHHRCYGCVFIWKYTESGPFPWEIFYPAIFKKEAKP